MITIPILLLPGRPNLSLAEERKICPQRSFADTAYCCGSNCAAFRFIKEEMGVCALIENMGAT